MRMIATYRVVAAQRQYVLDAQGGRAQQIRLQTQTVAVSTGELENGFQTRLLEQDAGG